VCALEARVAVDRCGGPTVAEADPDQIEQALINLVRNAVEASLGIESLSAAFPDFKQYPRPCQAVVRRRFESSFARLSPNVALSQSIQL